MDNNQQKQEIYDKIAELDAAEPMRLLRIERDKKIALTDWKVYQTKAPSDDWINYRQALRDFTCKCNTKIKFFI